MRLRIRRQERATQQTPSAEPNQQRVKYYKDDITKQAAGNVLLKILENIDGPNAKFAKRHEKHWSTEISDNDKYVPRHHVKGFTLKLITSDYELLTVVKQPGTQHPIQAQRQGVRQKLSFEGEQNFKRVGQVKEISFEEALGEIYHADFTIRDVVKSTQEQIMASSIIRDHALQD